MLKQMYAHKNMTDISQIMQLKDSSGICLYTLRNRAGKPETIDISFPETSLSETLSFQPLVNVAYGPISVFHCVVALAFFGSLYVCARKGLSRSYK
jgi:hypothetical protein